MFNYKLLFLLVYIVSCVLYVSINLIVHAVVMLASVWK